MNQQQVKSLDTNEIWNAFKNGKTIQFFDLKYNAWRDKDFLNAETLLQYPERFRVEKAEFPALKEGQKWHNPQNLTPAQVGVKEGWRPLLKSELNNPPKDSMCATTYDSTWLSSMELGGIKSTNLTYRTKALLPSVCPFKVGDKIKSKSLGDVLTIAEFLEDRVYYKEVTGYDFVSTLEKFYELYIPEYVALEEKDFPAGTLAKLVGEKYSLTEYEVFTTPQGILLVECCKISYTLTFDEAKEKLLIMRPGEDWVKCQKEKK